jgi:formate/nitrite transporter FocA (FNT family)
MLRIGTECLARSVTFTVGTLAGRTTLFALFTNLTLSFLGNLAGGLTHEANLRVCSLLCVGALFFEGILVYYADATLLADPYKTFVANTAVTKVHVPGWYVSHHRCFA